MEPESNDSNQAPKSKRIRKSWSPMEKAAVKIAVTSGAMTMAQVSRELGISENTIKAWSAKEGWLDPDKQKGTPAQNVQTLATKVAESLADIRDASRHAAGRAAKKGLEHLAEKDPEQIIAKSKQLKDLVDASAKATGYDTDQNTNNLVVSLGFLDDTARPVKATVVSPPSSDG